MTTFNVFGGIDTQVVAEGGGASFIENTFQSTYKDDHTDSAGFHRVLFNSGRAVQARELTQLQTIIQSEISRFGKNIFKDGAPVNPGNATIAQYEFIKLNSSVNTLPVDYDSLKGGSIIGQTSAIEGRVLEVIPSENGDPDTLYIQYTATSGFANPDDTVTPRFVAAEDIEITTTSGTTTLTVQTINTTLNRAVGAGTAVSSAPGDFFVEGHFVFAPAQSILVDKYAVGTTTTVGFVVIQDIVTAFNDDSLYDNQGSVPNITSPGADRYRIRLQLKEQNEVDSDQNFVFYANIRNGSIVQQTSGADEYNKIADLLALRTREESGDYIVNRFDVKMEDDPDNTILQVNVSAGTAYVNGRRAHSPVNEKLVLTKPISTTTVNNEVVAAGFGNYINFTVQNGLPSIATNELLTMYSAVTLGGTAIGTARVRALEEDGAEYRAYLFDVKMDTAKSFRSVRSIGTSGTNYFDLVLENGLAVLKETSQNNMLFPLPLTRPQLLSDISLTVQREFTATNAASSSTISLTTPGETFANTTSWVTSEQDGNIYSASITGAGTQSSTVTGGPASGPVTIMAYVNKGNGTHRIKTLLEDTITAPIQTDSAGVNYIALGKTDIFTVSRVRLADSDGQEAFSNFDIDNGQRDNFYGHGRLNVKAGFSAPSGNVFARFQYFAHGAAGDFFCVNSYSGAVGYADIPSFRQDDGETVSLRDIVDFRPVQDSDMQFSNISTGARINEIPQNTDLVTTDATYYNSRRDLVVISERGELSIVTGEESLNPQFPESPTDALELYRLELNANTLNETDLVSKMIESKHFTMADIGRLETQVHELEETTALSLLESNTSNLFVFDSAGLPRTKSGFLVDNFRDHTSSATWLNDYVASMDLKEGLLRPSFSQDNIRLIYDAANSTGVIKMGDNIYLEHTSTPEITQDLASTTENVNPFAVVLNQGFIDLSPASDEWFDFVSTADRVVDGGTRIVAEQAQLFNAIQWNWVGGRQLSLGGPANVGGTTGRWVPSARAVATPRVSTTSTVREVIGNRVVDVALIPWMRSRKVHFKAEGLRPNTRYFPFFDERNITDWCREESFVRFSDDEEDYGNRYINAVAHPDGVGSLTSDGIGQIEGSFFVPNSTSISQYDSKRNRYRTGTRNMTLLDINKWAPVESLSQASGIYKSVGIIETWQRTIRSTRVTTIVNVPRRVDPLAQSIYVEDPNGIFVTKVDVFFKTKDAVIPVQMQIRPMVNGHPSSSEIVPGAIKYLPPAQVSVSTGAMAAVKNTPTTFEFDEPVYLSPETEYAIVLLADSTDYNAYVAETEQFVLGSFTTRIRRQASLGSLFKSQNGSTWEPSQKQDMMFVVHRAEFTSLQGEVIMHNADVPVFQLSNDPFSMDSGSTTVFVRHGASGVGVGDTVKISGLDSAADYSGMLGTSLIGNRSVIAADGSGYTFASDSAALQSGIAGGTFVEASRNIVYDIAMPMIQNMLPNGCRFNLQGKFTTGKSIAGAETRYSKDTVYSNIEMSENNLFTAPRMIANVANEVANLGAGVKSADIKMIISTLDASVTPVVDMQRASLITIHNTIDNQDSSAGTGFNVPINFVGELVPSGGSALARHITVPVTLDQDAVGLNVFLGVNRPPATSIDVYYRTSQDGLNLEVRNWVEVSPISLIQADKNPDVYREYEYLIGGSGGDMTPFTKFQIKIVFNSTNSAQVPQIRDLRAIALAV